MELKRAKSIAYTLMRKHGLEAEGWKLKIDNAKRRAGCCIQTLKVISLSREYIKLNDDEFVTDLVLHEIAHALVGARHGHNRVWKKQARAIGCTAERYIAPTVVRPKAKFKAVCSSCGHEYERFRLYSGNQSCGVCAPRQYDERYKLVWVKNKT